MRLPHSLCSDDGALDGVALERAEQPAGQRAEERALLAVEVLRFVNLDLARDIA